MAGGGKVLVALVLTWMRGWVVVHEVRRCEGAACGGQGFVEAEHQSEEAGRVLQAGTNAGWHLQSGL